MAQAHEISNVLQAQRAHEELLNVALARAKLDRHEAHWLVVAYRAQANRLLGCASFAEYSERVLGHTPRVTEERLRVARALQDLPALAEALEPKARTRWNEVIHAQRSPLRRKMALAPLRSHRVTD